MRGTSSPFSRQIAPSREPSASNLLAFLVRKCLEHFPCQLAHSSLQVRDGDSFGIFQISQRVQNLFSRVVTEVGSSRDLDHESCLWRHVSPLCRGHSIRPTLVNILRRHAKHDLTDRLVVQYAPLALLRDRVDVAQTAFERIFLEHRHRAAIVKQRIDDLS